MTMKELIERLDKEKIPENSYSLNGGMLNDRICLAKTPTGWEVYYSETGQKFDVKTYSLEEEACDDLYNRLIRMMKFM